MYYPKSQIKTNLYTNGEDFIMEQTKTPYRGYYWETSTGEYFSGQTPNDPYSVRLIKPVDVTIISPDTVSLAGETKEILGYLNAQNKDINQVEKVALPYFNPTHPTQEDYNIGEFRRYFCKKLNEIIYIEINKEQYELLLNRDPQILFQLYVPFYLPWIITGDEEQVATTNKNIVELNISREKLPKFGDYLRFDYLKYYK